MLSRLSSYFRQNVIGFVALFVALGGSAYAVNTVNSTDIVDGQVKSVDVGDNEIKSADVKDQSLTTFDVSTFLGADVVDGTLTTDDIQDETITHADIADGLVLSSDIADNNLTGADIAEGTIGSGDVTDGAIGGVDIADGSVRSADIGNGSLTAQDVGENQFLNFAATIPALGAVTAGPNNCATVTITGIAAQSDHLLLTPNASDGDFRVVYQLAYHPADANATMIACNTSDDNVPSKVTHFNLIVFQH